MSRREDKSGGAWFIAPRIAELGPTGQGAPGACSVCGAEVWVEADDAGLAQSCAAIACPHCTGAVQGILFMPPASRDLAPEALAEPVVSDLPPCSGCGEPVEAHDPAWLEDQHGAVRPSSLRNFDEQARRNAWRLWHVDCYTAQRVDAPS